MSKQTKVQKQISQLTFGVDEAVEVLFVKYLANVDAKLAAANETLGEAQEAYDERIAEIQTATDLVKYNYTSETLGITARVVDFGVEVGNTVADSRIRITLKLTDTDIVSSNYQPEMGKYRILPLLSKDYDKLVTRNKALTKARSAVAEIKERNTHLVKRTLRASVMAVRLSRAGYDIKALFADETIAAIINV